MDIDIMERFPQESSREYVYRFLKTNIMSLRILPGAALSEKDISLMLNTSRTPVREAFIQLSQEYLLDILPQKGTYVSLIDIDSVEESRFLRETLEKAVIQIACQNFPSERLFELHSYITVQELCVEENNYVKFYELDEKLHSAIFAGCRKARIWSLIQQIHTHYNRVRMLNLAEGHDLKQLLEQHKEIIQAIREKDLALGKRAIEQHLNKVRIDIPELVKLHAEYFKNPEQYLRRIASST